MANSQLNTCPKLYADDTCIVFQHKNVTEVEKQLLRDFSSLFE